MALSIETVAAVSQLLIPLFAVLGLWIARVVGDQTLKVWAERLFFALMILVAFGTMRTMLANDPCWLLHTTSLSLMVVGAVFPNASQSVLET